MKKFLVIITACVMILTAFAGCGTKSVSSLPNVSSVPTVPIQPQSQISVVSEVSSVVSTPASVVSEVSKTSSVVSSKISSAVSSSKTSSVVPSQPQVITGSTDLFNYEITAIGITITKYKGTKTEVTVPAVIDGKTVVAVGANAFAGTAVISVAIENGIASIGDKAFSGCTALEFVSVPATVAAISLSSFDGSTKARIAAPSGCAAATFAANSGITATYPYQIDNGIYKFEVYDTYVVILSCKSGDAEITVPTTLYGKTVTVINTQTFVNLPALTKVTLPQNLTALLTRAFVGCTALQTVVFPASIIRIGDNAVENCPNVKFDAPDNTVAQDYALRYLPTAFVRTGTGEGFNYNVYTNQVKITAYIGTASSVIIPNRIENLPVTGIETGAFLNNTFITSVTMSDKIYSIGKEVFSGCLLLNSVHLSNALTEITERLFYNCIALSSVNIPTKITVVDNYAFYRCSITSVMLPSTVLRIGDSAFYECSRMTYIPLGDALAEIGSYSFAQCSSLYSITLPRSLLSFGDTTFSGCTSLRIYAYTGSAAATILTNLSIAYTALA